MKMLRKTNERRGKEKNKEIWQSKQMKNEIKLLWTHRKWKVIELERNVIGIGSNKIKKYKNNQLAFNKNKKKINRRKKQGTTRKRMKERKFPQKQNDNSMSERHNSKKHKTIYF